MARTSSPLFLVYDVDGLSYTKKLRQQSGKNFVMHNGQVMEVRRIGYESINTDEKIPTGKPIYAIVGEFSLQNTLV